MNEFDIDFNLLEDTINRIINEHPESCTNIDKVLNIIRKLKYEKSIAKRPGGMSEEEWKRLPPLEREYLERIENEREE